MKNIHLYGDSIFDNASYVDPNRAVTDHMKRLLPNEYSHQLFAMDGDTTRQCLEQIHTLTPKLKVDFKDTAVLSIGGNDALQSAGVLFTPVRTVRESFERMMPMIEDFRKNYEQVVNALLKSYYNIRICTIYNKIPGQEFGVGPVEMMALGLYNDVITETASKYNIDLIDLRVVCDSLACYSTISPIEPSDEGGQRIAQAIINSVCKG